MNTLTLSIENLRSIKSLQLQLPLAPGLYALTGKNGSGKSTAMAAIANLFYNDILRNYFSNSTEEGSLISYDFKNIKLSYRYASNKWGQEGRKIYLHGFYEGSLIHGNRFRDTHFNALLRAAHVRKGELIECNPEIKKNLGLILYDDPNRYSNLQKLSSDRAKQIFKFRSSPYFLVNGEKLISQLSLSTGENLLLSLLHSIYTHIVKRQGRDNEYFILLDEVELALHPSALIRLLGFLEQLSQRHRVAIYFSTHSTDLIRRINPQNIYFLNKHHDFSVEVINPCFPAYATRSIYMHDGYDYLILVEDILSKKIVNWVLKKHNLLGSKLVHILPCGGWQEVIAMHQEILASNFLGSGKKAFSILDGDSEDLFTKKYRSNDLYKNLNVAFLPIPSAEKFLRKKLYDDIDLNYFRHFNDMFFHKTSLDDIMDRYQKEFAERDTKGKMLLKLIQEELRNTKTTVEDISDDILEYLVHHENMDQIGERIKKSFK